MDGDISSRPIEAVLPIVVIAVASACVVLDPSRLSVAVALGSVGPTVLRCPEAEQHLASSIDFTTFEVSPTDLERFAGLVSTASSPITDHRSSAEYRRHAVGVLAKRLVRRASSEEVAA